MVGVADWADTQADSDQYHFSHTPYRDCKEFKKSRDCRSGKCLVTGLAMFLSQAIDASASTGTRGIALKYLIHLVADAAQPLHTGFEKDAGGNGISLEDPNSGSTLHDLWDHGLLDWYRSTRPTAQRSWEAIAEYLFENQLSIDKRIAHLLPLSLFETEEGFASAMVSDTATSLTCDSAYKTEMNQWIKNLESLSRVYMMTRSAKMLGQLLKAAVRLAQVIDVVSEKYSETRKAAKNSAKLLSPVMIPETSEVNPTTNAESKGKNYYEILFPFDPEEHLFDTDDAKETLLTLPRVSTTTRRPLTEEEEKAYAENALGDHMESMARRTLEGINLDALVLIKRQGYYFVTYRRLVQPLKTPNFVTIVDICFAHSTVPFSFRLDREMLTELDYFSSELVLAIFKELKGIFEDLSQTAIVSPDVSVSWPDPYRWLADLLPRLSPRLWTNYRLFRRKTLEGLLTSNPEADARRKAAETKFLAQKDKIVSIVAGRLLFVSRLDLLLSWESIERIRLNCRPIRLYHSSGTQEESDTLIVFDARVFPEYISVKAVELASSKTDAEDVAIQLFRINNRLVDVLHDLNKVVNQDQTLIPSRTHAITAVEPVSTDIDSDVFMIDIVLK